MPGRLLSFAQQAFRPLLEIVDVTELLLCRPREAARLLVEPAGSKRAVAYFLSSFSLAVILNRIGHYALGLESFSDFPYWAFHAGVIFAAALIGLCIAKLLRSISPTATLNAYSWAYGTSFVLSTMFLAGTSLTILAAHNLGYIPPVTIDPALRSNVASLYTAMVADCRRAESVAFATLYHAFYAAFTNIHSPIDSLSYVLPAAYLLGVILSAIQIYYASKRRALLSAILIASSSIVFFLAVFVAVGVYVGLTERNSACTPERIIDTAYKQSAPDYVRGLASKLTEHIGEEMTPGIFVSAVEADHLTVVVRANASPKHISEDRFRQWIAAFRDRVVTEYCASRGGQLYQKLGIAQVYVFSLAGTGKVERVIQSPDACRR